ncbi:MAG: Octanoyltransferase LipM [Chlamydiae bacterium]|nr:Octanoyltransferase LipM [Chlamydiota bacterium]
MVWKLIDSGKRSAEENMAIDSALLLDMENTQTPILHLYDWAGDSATYGHFVDPIKFLNLEAVVAHGLHLAKRPTGGGIVFHNCDLAFSVLIPAMHPSFSQRPLDNYAFINERVLWAIQQFIGGAPELLPEEPEAPDPCCKNFCMAKPTKYDVMISGRKVGGAAQRKTRHGYLHQGSISLGMLPDDYLTDLLAPNIIIMNEIRKNSFPLLGDKWTKKALSEARRALSELLKRAFCDEMEGGC